MSSLVEIRKDPVVTITGLVLAREQVERRNEIRSQIGWEWGKFLHDLYQDWESPATFEGIICNPGETKVGLELYPVLSRRQYAQARVKGTWFNVDQQTGRGVGIKRGDYSVLNENEADFLFSVLGQSKTLASVAIWTGLVTPETQGLAMAVFAEVECDVKEAVSKIRPGFLSATLLKDYFSRAKVPAATLEKRLSQLRTLAAVLEGN